MFSLSHIRNQTMSRGNHGSSRGGTLPHQPSKKPDLVLSDDSAYGFLKSLPRELRDEIYDLVAQPKRETHHDYHFETLKVVTNLRLVSRQVKQEYDERPPLNTHLEATQCYQHDWSQGGH
jgi:hypothetical protein